MHSQTRRRLLLKLVDVVRVKTLQSHWRQGLVFDCVRRLVEVPCGDCLVID